MYDLIESAKKGDKLSLEEIVKKNSGLVWSVVKRFLQRGYDGEDLYQIGAIGLIKAIERFDSSYEVRFSTYAVPLITGEIRRFLRDDGIIKVSRHYKEINSKAQAVRKSFEACNMRKPTLSEISTEMGITVFELTEAMEACTPCDSIHRTVCEDGKNEVYLLDKIAGSEDSLLLDKASLKCAIDELDERERAIIAYRYFMDETQTVVAKRLKISQVQVSRIEKRAIQKLREYLR